MKRFIKYLLCFSLLISSFSCEKQEGDAITTDFKMKAIVKSINEKIEVEVTEAEYAYGPYWIIYNDQTVFLDKNGNKSTVESISVGDTVEIYYNGQVMMSYPPQVAALKISVL